MTSKPRRGKQATHKNLSSDAVNAVDDLPVKAGQPSSAVINWLPTSAIEDGTQAVLHDAYDVQVYNEAFQSYSRLPETLQKVHDNLATAPALMRDVFNSVYKRLPNLCNPADMSPAYIYNREMVEQMMSTVEWKRLREAGTVADEVASTLATIGLVPGIVTAVDPNDLELINRAQELQERADSLFERAEVLSDLSDLVAPTNTRRGEQLRSQAQGMRKEAEELQEQAAQIEAELAQTAEERQDAVRRAARGAALQAEQQVDQLAATLKAFTGGYGDVSGGAGMGAGPGGLMDARERLALAQQVLSSAKLRQLAEMCGRFVRLALDVQQTKLQHGPDEYTDIISGADLGRVLASELCKISDPELEDLFYLGFAEQRLMQYHLQGRDPVGKGPILIAIDSSGSMSERLGTFSKEMWAKAVTLALLAIARRQRRDMAVLHFSDGAQLKTFFFPWKSGSVVDHRLLVACAEHYFGGGTEFEPWMREALKLVEQAPFELADVVCISDGLTVLSKGVISDWQSCRERRGMRCYSVLLGTQQGRNLLDQISDQVLSLADLSPDSDEDVLKSVFVL
ncbi:MAG: VWA domain-containing protein [Chloroflexi bacterium]|nr:VWA domain-containing protein [Chloroflexota bacterium]